MAEQTKQTPSPAANTNQQAPTADKAVKQPTTPDYTKVTDSGNAWEDTAKAVREAGSSQQAGDPTSRVNNVDDSGEVGTTSEPQMYADTETGKVVEASSAAEAVTKLNENKDKGTK